MNSAHVLTPVIWLTETVLLILQIFFVVTQNIADRLETMKDVVSNHKLVIVLSLLIEIK